VSDDDLPIIGYRPAGPLALLDPRARSLGCAMCGSCCEEIVLGFDPRTFKADRDPENAELYRDYWVVEWVDDHGSRARRPWRTTGYVVTCKAYDVERRACTHPRRPPICRDYPHYFTVPSSRDRPERITVRSQDGPEEPFGCSYGLDSPGWSRHGRPLIPVEVVRG
jgi:Fe-S-cluster containining protein